MIGYLKYFINNLRERYHKFSELRFISVTSPLSVEMIAYTEFVSRQCTSSVLNVYPEVEISLYKSFTVHVCVTLYTANDLSYWDLFLKDKRRIGSIHGSSYVC